MNRPPEGLWAELVATLYAHHEVACTTCGAEPWHPCQRRTTGQWAPTHKARLVAPATRGSQVYEARVRALHAYAGPTALKALCRPSATHTGAQLGLVRLMVEQALARKDTRR